MTNGDLEKSESEDFEVLVEANANPSRGSLNDSIDSITGGGGPSSPRDDNDSSCSLFRDTDSEWEEGVAVIDSLLRNASVSLTQDQVAGLQKVRTILLGRQDSNQNMHVPKELLRNCSGTNDYLLAQFAGVDKPENPAIQRVKNVITANRFVQGLKLKVASSRLMHQHKAYALPEWLKLDPAVQVELAGHLSWEKLNQWDFDIFEVARLTNNQPLLFLGWAILGSPYSQHVTQDVLLQEGEEPPPRLDMPGYGFVDQYRIPQQTLVDFLRTIEADYTQDIPYHNNTHAADVLQSLHCILNSMDGMEYAISDLALFSVLLSAVVHDVGHKGYNNNFQVNSQSDLALQYNDTSVLENMHASLAFKRIMGSQMEPKINILHGMSNGQVTTCRKMIIESVLNTDMTKHFSTVNKIKGIRHTNSKDSHMSDADCSEILHFALHIADISNPAKSFSIATQWADRCLDEFFLQGDAEKKLGLPVSPLCDRLTTKRADSQIGFIEFVVQPAFVELGKSMPAVASEICPIIEQNLRNWRKEKAEEAHTLEEIEEERGQDKK